MTKFLDGPAEGVVLVLRYAPLFLRAVRNAKGKWDALDKASDMPELGETVYVYRRTKLDDKDVGHVHVCMRGGKGGYFAMAEYTLHGEQPDDAIARNCWEWPRWADEQAKKVRD